MLNQTNDAMQPRPELPGFGFGEFWSKVYDAYKPGLQAIVDDSSMASHMFTAAQTKMSEQFEEVELAIYLLVSMTATGMQELLILAGNGAGMGATKISRGMFESAVMAEYLRRNPLDVRDYIDYGRVLSWKRVQQYPHEFTPQQRKKAENEYNQVKPRFIAKNGNVRNQWNKNSLRYMAVATGREDQYDLPYSIATSMHHGNFEAMLSHIKLSENTFSIDDLPSMKWVRQALVSGHVYLLQALETLNAGLQLGFEGHLEPAMARLQNVWGNDRSVATMK